MAAPYLSRTSVTATHYCMGTSGYFLSAMWCPYDSFIFIKMENLWGGFAKSKDDFANRYLPGKPFFLQKIQT